MYGIAKITSGNKWLCRNFPRRHCRTKYLFNADIKLITSSISYIILHFLKFLTQMYMCVRGHAFVCYRTCICVLEVMCLCVIDHVFVCWRSCICVLEIMCLCVRGHVFVCYMSCVCVLEVMCLCVIGHVFVC
jgi:hypothetical protein